MIVLITGCNGMIGRYATSELLEKGYEVIGVGRSAQQIFRGGFSYVQLDLADQDKLAEVFAVHEIKRVVHLAALAHIAGEDDLSKAQYYLRNVICAAHVFEAAAQRQIPILFSSTVDVYGMTRGSVSVQDTCEPVSVYAQTKLVAEQKLKELCAAHDAPYTIMRFAPVYTPDIKRDIQKRYYLRYPNWAYQIGNGMEYEVLNIRTAVNAIAQWVSEGTAAPVLHVKDERRLSVAECLAAEKTQGRARHVLRCPRWLATGGYQLMKFATGKNKYTYLLHKALYPVRTE